jgi:hypothetical protein
MVSLLRPGGQILIGDIPNLSMRNLFFASGAGAAYHKQHAGDDLPLPKIEPTPQANKIDDSVLLSILERYRKMGMDVYIMPQNPALPMATRREDIVMRKA